ncbi:hypothetical protein AVEN_183307-1 [Araneus ventricosus]|uniref:Double jelly roll-like domain-containing protein n=1 Tax=Araneus ventricosus TaxID=182803 RepID=A0A4Y2UDK5_ARAVE|nr:hypothetical protein AVEN_183307-1 [Araneus ventricosus]
MEKIYDLRETHYFQNDTIEKFEYIEIECENKSDIHKEEATYNFNIRGEDDNIFYSDGYLHQQLKITDSKGESIANKKVSLVNGGGLIKSKKLKIGSTVIESNTGYCEILDQVIRQINFTPEYTKSEGKNMLFIPDTYDTVDINKFRYEGVLIETTKITDFFNNLKINEKYNKGFDKRYYFTKNSQTVHIWIPLKYIFDFFNEYRKVLSGFHVRMEFERNHSKNMLITNEVNPDFRVEVENISLLLPYVQFRNDARIRFEELKTLKSYIDIYWDHFRINVTNTQLKVSNGSWPIPTEWDEVSAVYIVPQYLERADDYKKNNLIFDNLNIIEYWITVNGQDYPEKHYKVDFPKKAYNHSYTAVLKAGNNGFTSETGSNISYEAFGELYPILCIDLSAHKNLAFLNKRILYFNWKLQSNTQKDYRFYVILKERNKCYLNMYKNEFTFAKKDD